MHRTFALLASSLTCSFAVACSSSDGPACEPSELAAEGADTPQIVRFNEPFRWVDASFEEATPAASAALALFTGEPLPAEHAAVRWLNAWLEHVDAMVREDARRELGEELRAPKPILRVQTTSSDAPLAVAVNALVSVQAPRNDVQYSLVPTRRSNYPATAPFLSISGGPALARPGSWNDTAGFVDYLKTYAGIGNVELEDERLVFGCDDLEGYPSTEDSGVGVDAMTPYVVISVAVAKRQSEDAMLTTLTHELSHFYRAHGSAGAIPAYWFENAERPTWEPPQSAAADAIDKAYRAALGESVDGADPALVERARANELGFMTLELQADRLSDHLLRRLGLDADATLAVFRELLDAYDTTSTKPGCLARIDEKFATPIFEPIFTPNLTTPGTGHPSLCYRAYDAWRQASASSIPVGTRPDLGVGSWQDAQAEL